VSSVGYTLFIAMINTVLTKCVSFLNIWALETNRMTYVVTNLHVLVRVKV
jgi:hypothetical protein